MYELPTHRQALKRNDRHDEWVLRRSKLLRARLDTRTTTWKYDIMSNLGNNVSRAAAQERRRGRGQLTVFLTLLQGWSRVCTEVHALLIHILLARPQDAYKEGSGHHDGISISSTIMSFFLAADCGGSKTAICISDSHGRLVARAQVPLSLFLLFRRLDLIISREDLPTYRTKVRW